MPQVVDTNFASLNAQRYLNTSQSALHTSLQRISSGLRINSAKDDAAGMAISEPMAAQIRGLNQAQRNANDGFSLSQTAESALASSGDILHRMRELAVQAANAGNSAGDRQSIQNEIGQLGVALDRIASAAQFNGKNLFDGTFGTVNFQVGANANQAVTASASSLRIAAYGNNQFGANGAGLGAGALGGAAPLAAGSFDINGYNGSKTITVAATDSAASIANSVNNVAGGTGVSATARNDILLSFAAAGTYSLQVAGDNATTAMETVTFSLSAVNSASGLSDAVTAFNDKSAKTGLVASLNAANTGVIVSNASGANVEVADTAFQNAGDVTVQGLMADQATALGAAVTLTADGVANSTYAVGQVTFDSPKSFSAVQAAGNMFAAATQGSLLNNVANLDVTTFLNATQAIRTIDAAQEYLNDERAKFGALQKRLESTIANLSAISENLSASHSRIMDADFAVETANLTRGQILQKAGVAMLSQANSSPGNVLSLLK